ncbi:SRPBCC family protein [Mycolicibacterium boenickei]
MSLPALEDITVHRGSRTPLDGLVRIETSPKEKATPIIMDMMRSVYPHDQVFGEYCTVNDYIECPPDELFDYLSDTRCLEEWTYSLRGFTPTEEPGLWLAHDRLGAGPTSPGSAIYTRTVANRDALTVDYHCAWDQGKHLWMIYLMRIVDAQVVLDKPGSVVLWTNCHHPFYDENPYPETAPPARPVWVGDFWDMFGPGHLLELRNLKAIAEYRHRNGLPVTPDWMK